MVGKPVNPKCELRVECVGNRHDDNEVKLVNLGGVVGVPFYFSGGNLFMDDRKSDSL